MRSQRLASHSKSKPSSSSSLASPDSPAPTVTDGPPATPATPQTPSSRKPLQMPDAAAAPVAASPAPAAATSRRSERKRKPREFAERSSSAVRHKKTWSKVWSERDEIALLEGVLAFRSSTGALPTKSGMGAFFDTIKSAIGSHLTAEQTRYKFRRLKAKFIRSAPAGPSEGTPAHERRIFELSSQIWNVEAKQAHGDAEEEVNGDVPEEDEEEKEEEEDYVEKDDYPFIREAVVEYWKMNGPCPSRVLLERGLKLIDPSKGKELEKKLRKQSEAEMATWMKRLDLLKEISKLLSEAHKGSSL